MIFRLLVLLLLPVMAYYLVKSARSRFNLTPRQTQILFAIMAALLVVAVLVLMGRLPVQFIFAPLGAAGAFLLRFLPTLLASFAVLANVAKSNGSGKTRKRKANIDYSH